ncbi:hypothetical protein D033_4035A, partial [Vibrio parahaemolyticus B-265]
MVIAVVSFAKSVSLIRLFD